MVASNGKELGPPKNDLENDALIVNGSAVNEKELVWKLPPDEGGKGNKKEEESQEEKQQAISWHFTVSRKLNRIHSVFRGSMPTWHELSFV